MTISDATTIANNSADEYGGGVFNIANMTISDATTIAQLG